MGVQEQINDFQMALYSRCCVERGLALPASEPQSCGFSCVSYPLTVDADGHCACIVKDKYFQDSRDDISNDFCSALEDLSVTFSSNSVPLVGESSEGGCGNGNPKEFQQVMTQYFEDYVHPVGIGFVCLGAILLLADFFVCCVIGKNSKNVSKKHHKDPGYDQSGYHTHQRTGGNLAGTGGHNQLSQV